MANTYQSLRMWSVMHDCDVVRISMWDDAGREFFVQLVDDKGFKAMRAGRENALDSIMDAMAERRDPGEVALVEYERDGV